MVGLGGGRHQGEQSPARQVHCCGPIAILEITSGQLVSHVGDQNALCPAGMERIFSAELYPAASHYNGDKACCRVQPVVAPV